MNKLKRITILALEFGLLFVGVLLFFDKNIVHPSTILLPVQAGLIFYFKKTKRVS